MGKVWRLLLLALVLNAALSTAALARTVYLADGGTIQAQKVWKEEGRIYLLLNRDSLIHFSPEEINLKKTFAKKWPKPVAEVAPAPVAAAVSPAAKVAPPVAKAAPVAAAASPATAKAAPPVAPKPAKPAAKKAPAPPPPPASSSLLDYALPGAGIVLLLVIIVVLWKVVKARKNRAKELSDI